MGRARIGALILVVVAGACSQTEVERDSPVLGAWEVIEMQLGEGEAPNSAASVQPGQFIFGPTRYSAVWVTQTAPRPVSTTPWEPTDEEIVGFFRSVAANSGTYDIDGTRLTIRPLVAKLPDIVGGYVTYEFRLEADLLFLEAVDEESGGRVKPPDYDSAREFLTLRRVEAL